MIFAGTGCCPLGCWQPTQRRTAKSTDENQNFKRSTQTKSCREKVSQVRFCLTLSTNHFDQGLFHAVLKKSCLESYKNASGLCLLICHLLSDKFEGSWFRTMDYARPYSSQSRCSTQNCKIEVKGKSCGQLQTIIL